MTVLATANLTTIAVLSILYIFFVLLDTGLGRLCARKKAKKKGKRHPRLVVTSKKTRLGLLSKILIFFVVMSFVFAIDHLVIDTLLFYWKNNFPFHYIGTAVFVLIFISWEIDSIDEHVYYLTGFTIIEKIKTSLKKGKELFFKILLMRKQAKDLE